MGLGAGFKYNHKTFCSDQSHQHWPHALGRLRNFLVLFFGSRCLGFRLSLPHLHVYPCIVGNYSSHIVHFARVVQHKLGNGSFEIPNARGAHLGTQ